MNVSKVKLKRANGQKEKEIILTPPPRKANKSLYEAKEKDSKIDKTSKESQDLNTRSPKSIFSEVEYFKFYLKSLRLQLFKSLSCRFHENQI